MSPNTSTSMLIGKAYRSVYKGSRQALAALNVPPAQYILLVALWEEDGLSGSQLGAILGLDSATMTGLLDRTTARGYIERRADPSDRRINRIWLTPAGQALEADVTRVMIAFDDSLAERVEGGVEQFNENLARLGQLN